MADKTPQFQDLTFKSRKEFNNWLIENQSKTVILDDLGQDMQRIHIHETGEILHCDFHAKLYDGKFINMEKLKPGQRLEIWDNDEQEWIVFNNLVITDVA